MNHQVLRRNLLNASFDDAQLISAVEIKEITLNPKQKAPLHLHPCTTLGIVTEGTISFQIEGQPVQYLKTGDAFHEPKNVRISKFDNDSDIPAKFAAFYLLEKDKSETIRVLEQK